MARFRNLEFDSAPDENEKQKSHEDVQARDEHYWLRLANEERRQGHFENALRYYSRALEIDKSLVKGWLGQVEMLIAQDENVEAELWSRKALELFRNNGDLLASRAQALARLGKRSEANSLCDAGLKQEGQSAYRWTVRGELLVAAGEAMDRHCFDKAMLLDRDWLVPLEIAAIYSYYAMPAKAITRLRQAADLAPDNAHVWYCKGCCELELDLEGAASKSFQRCLELNPNHTDADRKLAEVSSRGWSLRRILDRLLRRR